MNTRQEYITQTLGQRPDSRLPRHIFPGTATDIIIEYNNGEKKGIVLITRKNPPHGLALPGGFAEYGLSYEENTIKEAKEETGLDVILENPERPLCVHSTPTRDPRGHMTSITYVAKGSGELKAGDDAATANVFTREEIKGLIISNGLAFDHGRILEKYLEYRELIERSEQYTR
ncbi:NUDIX hydrolase [Candidatus Woesearchaeota archaeon]|nr:NUDIX hydrolase [Candidatus Woesearchaeota archaeon]